jgi:hypothetical protein
LIVQNAKRRDVFPSCHSDQWIWLGAFTIALVLTFCVYYPARSAWFVSDDYCWLKPADLSDLSASFHQTWGHGTAFRPLMRCSYYIDYQFFGDHASGWHTINFILHACNAAWVFLILKRLSRAAIISAITFILFILSPWGHENVAWISGRTYLLCSFFCLPSLYCYTCYADTGLRRWPVISMVLFLAGLLTYEAAVSLPFVMLILLIFNLPHPVCFPQYRSRLLKLIGFFLLILILFWIYRFAALGGTIGKVNATHADYLSGFLLNLRDVAYLLTLYFPLSLPLAVCSLLTTLYLLLFRQLSIFRLLVLPGLFLAIYLPFSALSGVTARFVYMAQIPFLVFYAIAITHWLRYHQRTIRLAAATYLGLSIILAGWTTFRLAGEWATAGETAYNIINTIADYADHHPTADSFILFDIPEKHRHAVVFKTYFKDAVLQQVPALAGKLHRAQDLSPREYQTLTAAHEPVLLQFDTGCQCLIKRTGF